MTRKKEMPDLEVWLAAGFDVPTAMAAAQEDSSDDEDPVDEPVNSAHSQSVAQPDSWEEGFSVLLGLGIAGLLMGFVWLIFG